MKRPSELKQRVAQNLRDAFEARGIACSVFPGDFRTADGFWRRVDVYRWQIYADIFRNGRWERVEVSGWDPLKDCARKGLTVEQNQYMLSKPWEAEPGPRRGLTGAKGGADNQDSPAAPCAQPINTSEDDAMP